MSVERRPRLTPHRRSVLDGLLEQLLDLDPKPRQARLDDIGRRYPRLHRWLARLLEASAVPPEQLGQAIARTARRAVDEQVSKEQLLPPGTRLGAWRIVEAAGQGGMGVVYRAERADGAFDMAAAIKLIRNTRPELADRLLQERRLLARLDHRGISRLIDGGMTSDEGAFLVMEWVPGEDLGEDNRESVDPLGVIGQVADAITHAHQRMVIHGDIKPGNVRIMPDDRVRLLDFGVARLLAESTDQDDPSVRALTPAFAAPEMLAGKPPTGQSDIWALGALLGWLLTGNRPEPGKPVAAEDIDHPRAAELAAILQRACADEPVDRFEAAAEFAEEIRRIQRHEPVLCAPAGPLRRLQLWSRRNPVGAVLAGMMMTGLVVGATLLAGQARVVTAERDLARFENTRWQIMRDHLVMLFQEVAVEADDRDALGARELLDGSAALLDQFMADDPLGKRHIESMLGSLYVALQDYASAAEILRNFVAEDDGTATPALRGQAYGNLAQSEERLGNHDVALSMVDEAITILEPLPGDHRRLLSELHQIRGRILRGTGHWSEAIQTLETGLEVARAMSEEPHRSLGFAQNNLGVTLLYAGRPIPAMQHFADSLETWQALGLGQSNDALNVMGNLASLKHQQGTLLEAEGLYRQVIELRERRYGGSAALASVLNNYGLLLLIRNRPDEAGEHLERALEMQARFVGENSPDYALSLRSRGMMKIILGDMEGAAADFDAAEAIMIERVGEDHLFTVLIRAHRANLERKLDPATAVSSYTEVIKSFERIGAPAEPQLAASLCELAILKLDLGQIEPALDSAHRCAEIRARRLIEGSWQTREALALVATAEARDHQPDAADRLHELVAHLATSYGQGHPRLAWFERTLADLQEF